MTNVVRKVVALIAIVASMTLATPTTAHAGADAFTVVGTGSTSPGLPCTGCHVHTDFTLAGAGTDGGGTAACTFDGTTGQDTLLQSSGDGTFSCDGGVDASGALHFDRTGPLATFSGSATINGSGCTITGIVLWIEIDLGVAYIWIGVWVCI